MKHTQKTAFLIAALGVLTAPANAQTYDTVVWHDDFDQFPVGANSGDTTGTNLYGRIAYNFTRPDYGSPVVMITNSSPDTLPGDPGYTHTNYAAFIFQSLNLIGTNANNFGWDINSIAATGNTTTELRGYLLSFDIAVQGDGMNSLGGFVGPILYVFGQDAAGTYSSGEYYGNGAQTNFGAAWFPAPGTGWTHVDMYMGSFGTANAGPLNVLEPAFSFGIGAYMAGLTVVGQEEIDIANLEIKMSTNLPPLAAPSIGMTRGEPGLRVFDQDSTQPYNQEGFGTQDPNQSWVGVASPTHPVSYAYTIKDFDTVDGFTLFVQFAQNAGPGDPFGVYNAQNAFVWTIVHNSAGFTTSIDWKTNAPASGQPNNVIALATTSTDGRGTWMLVFTNDTDGTVYCPDGTTGSFTLPNDPTWLADFANPLTIDLGIAPENVPGGWGQYITFSRIAITNVVDGDEIDECTQNTALRTDLWNTGFSFNNNPPSVIQVMPGSLWVTNSIPDNGYGLGTKASLNAGTNVWFTPNYYGSGVGATTSIPTVMGAKARWTLIPAECLPTTDGTVGGPVSPTGFFRISNPAPSQ